MNFVNHMEAVMQLCQEFINLRSSLRNSIRFDNTRIVRDFPREYAELHLRLLELDRIIERILIQVDENRESEEDLHHQVENVI